MSYRKKINMDVLKVGVQRMVEVYQLGGRVVVAFSGGKDSGVTLEVTKLAAHKLGIPKVEVWMLDDEIMYPGTFEYAEKVAEMPDVEFSWCVAGEPMPAVWNRESPYWWVFDNRLDPDQWVRKYPSYAKMMPSINLYDMINPVTFPPPPGKDLYIIIGNRVEESRARMMSIHGAKSFIPYQTELGNYKVYPIYDWTTADVWKAVNDYGWAYNSAYDVLTKMGMPATSQRIAPPTMTFFGMASLQIAAKAWPKWYDKVNERVPGAKAIANFGLKAVMPLRRRGETWEDCYHRECIENAPNWIRERAIVAMNRMLQAHSAHSQSPFPEVQNCSICGTTNTGSWMNLANVLYTGDPYSLKASFLPWVQPSTFRPDDTRPWKFSPAGFK